VKLGFQISGLGAPHLHNQQKFLRYQQLRQRKVYFEKQFYQMITIDGDFPDRSLRTP